MTPSAQTLAAPYAGTRLLENGRALSTAIQNGNWLDGGIAFFDTLSSAAAAAADPIGTIASAGLGWVINLLGPLKSWLEQLAGSEASVSGVASQWTSAGASMRSAGSTLAARTSDLEGLSGATVIAYLRFAQETSRQLTASGDWADSVSSGLTTASGLVARMQSVVKSAISKVLATAIEAMAVVAASFGLGMGYAIARVVTRVNEMVNKVAKPIVQVLRSVKSLVGFVQQMRSLFDSTSSLIATLAGNSPAATVVTAGGTVDAAAATQLGSTGYDRLTRAGGAADLDRTRIDAGMTGIGAPGSATGVAALTVDGSMGGGVSGGAGFSIASAGAPTSTGISAAGLVGSTSAGTDPAGTVAGTTAAGAAAARMMHPGVAGAGPMSDQRSAAPQRGGKRRGVRIVSDDDE
jgi:hypothetical protein